MVSPRLKGGFWVWYKSDVLLKCSYSDVSVNVPGASLIELIWNKRATWRLSLIDYKLELERIEVELDSLGAALDETNSERNRLNLVAQIDALEKAADQFRMMIKLLAD